MPKINDWDVERYLYESVSIERTNINEEFIRVPADLAYWGEQCARSERDEAEAKAELERVEASLYKKHRALLELASGKITESMVNAEVVNSAQYHGARESLIEASEAVKHCKSVTEAVKSKRDMLISLGAQMRAERSGIPQINEEPSLWPPYTITSTDKKEE